MSAVSLDVWYYVTLIIVAFFSSLGGIIANTIFNRWVTKHDKEKDTRPPCLECPLFKKASDKVNQDE